jgi:hypothetical protein
MDEAIIELSDEVVFLTYRASESFVTIISSSSGLQVFCYCNLTLIRNPCSLAIRYQLRYSFPSKGVFGTTLKQNRLLSSFWW